jgi:5,10-methylenetetrahydromethanopterin reductase
MIKPAMAASFHIGSLPRPAGRGGRGDRAAERLGFAGAWIADSQSIFRNGYAALTLAASRTSSIALASGVTNPLTRHPAVIASSLATLHEQSGGRAIIGIGIGESAVHTVGLRQARLRRLEQAAVAIRALARGEQAELDGGRLRLTWARSAIPLYLASSGPKSLQLAGRIADGVLFQVGAEPALVSYAIRNIREGMAVAGRPAGSVRLLARLACSVAADREWARREVRGYVAAAAGTTFAAVPREELPPALADDIRALTRCGPWSST